MPELEDDQEHPSEKQGPQDDGCRPHEISLHKLIDRQAQHARRDEGHNYPLDDLDIHQQKPPVQSDDGQDGPDLDGDLEALEKLRVLESHEVRCQDHVPRR